MLSLALILSLQVQARDREAFADLGDKRSGFGLPWKCPDNCRPHDSLDFQGSEALIFPAGSASIRYSIAATPDHRFHLSRQSRSSGKFPRIDWVIELVAGDSTKGSAGTLRGFLSTFNQYAIKGNPPAAIASELDRKGGFAVYTRHYSGKPYWFYLHDYKDPDLIPSFDTFRGVWPWSKTTYPVTSEEQAYLKR